MRKNVIGISLTNLISVPSELVRYEAHPRHDTLSCSGPDMPPCATNLRSPVGDIPVGIWDRWSPSLENVEGRHSDLPELEGTRVGYLMGGSS